MKTSRIDLTLTSLETINHAPTLSLSNSSTVGGFGPHAPSVISAFTAERNKANTTKDFIFSLSSVAERLCTTDSYVISYDEMSEGLSEKRGAREHLFLVILKVIITSR